jgi:hypothetical protein
MGFCLLWKPEGTVDIPAFATIAVPDFSQWLVSLVSETGAPIVPMNGAPGLGTWLLNLAAFVTNEKSEFLAGADVKVLK